MKANPFKLDTGPKADNRAAAVCGRARFTVLTDRLIRCEHSPDGAFEDRPSQHFWHRRREAPRFEIQTGKDGWRITTASLELHYREAPEGFTPETLSIKLLETGNEWCYGQEDPGNLRGTCRMLDGCNGGLHMPTGRPARLAPGLLSRSGWSVVDDSASPVFNGEGFLEPRPRRQLDFHFFGYGRDYAACLRDFYAVTGRPPLIPKWALGLWWSRWAKYTSADIERLITEFEKHGLPLSVFVIDMDWHLEGWTGYTWNPDFFPDPEGFFRRIHGKGTRACLNLHPASGVGPHEEAYEAMARHMGMDPSSKERVPFDIADPRFIEGYFKYLHHPREAEGVDFWWIDWQQGKESKLAGLDPLFYLNHLHARDLARDGTKRPFILSRYCGVSGHRYPAGFSGDTYVTWEGLRYQVYFTATAANAGFGCWSHDIGGFARGVPDEELYVRWVQFGCFSPVFRFHNCGDPDLDYRPWTKTGPYGRAAAGHAALSPPPG